MSPRQFLAPFALVLAWACSDDEKPPPGLDGPSEGGDAGNGASGSSGRSGDGGASDGGADTGGGAGGDANGGTTQGGAGGTDTPGGAGGEPSGGTGGIPPCPSDSLADPPSGLTALCAPSGGWGPTVDVPLMDGAAQLLAVTPDELTIAFYGVANMDTTFYVADRTTTTVDFDPSQELEVRAYVTLSPDGLRLVALSETGQLVELVRSARGQVFGVPSEGSFSTLDAAATADDLVYLGAAISPDDRALYYLANDGQGDQPLRVSRRTGSEPWPVGTVVEACEFQTHGGLMREPTGISADGLTLFFNDAVRGQARAAWRESEDEPFVWFVDLGIRDRAQPNADCSRMYYTATSGPAYSEAD